MRLDVYLADNGLVDSRTDAKKFILAGSVKVNGVSVTKPAFDVDGAEEITVDKSSKKYVSRGGLKLEGALEIFGINTEGVYAIDIGASSGGFTDCLLKRGAMHVIAVDSGSGQMVELLRADPRVTVIENFDIEEIDIPFLIFISMSVPPDNDPIRRSRCGSSLHQVFREGLPKPQNSQYATLRSSDGPGTDMTTTNRCPSGPDRKI
jgi:TlyA family rRNA methyltransferase/putative hemolysin